MENKYGWSFHYAELLSTQTGLSTSKCVDLELGISLISTQKDFSINYH